MAYAGQYSERRYLCWRVLAERYSPSQVNLAGRVPRGVVNPFRLWNPVPSTVRLSKPLLLLGSPSQSLVVRETTRWGLEREGLCWIIYSRFNNSKCEANNDHLRYRFLGRISGVNQDNWSKIRLTRDETHGGLAESMTLGTKRNGTSTELSIMSGVFKLTRLLQCHFQAPSLAF